MAASTGALISETESFDRLSGSECENPENPGSSETSGLPQKRKKYSCSYRKEYNKRFPWATDSKKDSGFLYFLYALAVVEISAWHRVVPKI